MDELMWLRMMGGFGGSVDVTALIAFIAYGTVYLIAPVLGYEEYRPNAWPASLGPMAPWVTRFLEDARA